MNAAAVLESHQLANSAFECGIRQVGVGPFDDDRLRSVVPNVRIGA